MKLREVLDIYRGCKVKIGMGTSFVYCDEWNGTEDDIKELNELSEYERKLFDIRIKKYKSELNYMRKMGREKWAAQHYEQYIRKINALRNTSSLFGSNDSHYNIDEFKRRYDSKVGNLSATIQNTQNKKKKFVPFMDCEVKEIYGSIIYDDVMIIVCKNGVAGRFWDIEEYRKFKETGIEPKEEDDNVD